MANFAGQNLKLPNKYLNEVKQCSGLYAWTPQLSVNLVNAAENDLIETDIGEMRRF